MGEDRVWWHAGIQWARGRTPRHATFRWARIRHRWHAAIQWARVGHRARCAMTGEASTWAHLFAMVRRRFGPAPDIGGRVRLTVLVGDDDPRCAQGKDAPKGRART